MVLLHYRKPWVKALNSFLKIMNLKNTTTMKKLFTIMLAVLLSSIAAQAQEADYQPLVREGVRWVNVHEAFHGDYSCYFYNFEFRGDTIINGKTYKKCYKYTGKALDLSKDTAYCAMRNEGHKVYEVPFNGLNENFETAWWWSYSENETIWNELNTTGEFTLFDFDNPFDPWDWDETPSRMSPKMAAVMANSSFKENFIPGIGFDNEDFGDAFHPFVEICTCIYYDTYGFHHLEDLDGNILYQGAAFDREENIYSPIVREGVVWEYLYVNEDNTMSVERFQILGDTVITIHDSQPPHNFKKCYRYFGDNFDPDNLSPIAYMEEWGRTIMVITPPIEQHRSDEFISDFGGTYSLPSYWGYEKTGEREIYWFEDVNGLMQDVNELYGCDYFSANDSVVTFVAVGDQMNRCFSITGIGMVDGKWIEGVGIDGYHTGNLITPLAPSGETGTQGLIRLADLDGNTLYEGAYYNSYYGIKYDVNHDGMVDIADINILINVMLGYDVPTGHQGHDTIPAEAAEKIMDVTGDNHVDITDINTLINKMLGK